MLSDWTSRLVDRFDRTLNVEEDLRKCFGCIGSTWVVRARLNVGAEYHGQSDGVTTDIQDDDLTGLESGRELPPPPYHLRGSDLGSVWESGVVGMAHCPLHSDGLGGVVTGALGVSPSDGDMRVDRWFVRWMTARTPWMVSRWPMCRAW